MLALMGPRGGWRVPVPAACASARRTISDGGTPQALGQPEKGSEGGAADAALKQAEDAVAGRNR